MADAQNVIGDYAIGGVSTPPDWQIIFNSSNQRISFWRGTSIVTTDANTVLLNTWMHAVLVRSDDSSNNCHIYLNGVLSKSGTFTTTVGRGLNLWIGIDGDGISEPFNGTIDEVRIYDAALEASQIKARYVQGLNKLHSKGKLNGKEYYQRLTETGF